MAGRFVLPDFCPFETGDVMAASSTPQDHGAERTERTVVLVNGSNVAHSSEGERVFLSNIVAVCDKLREEGYEPLVLTDAALRHQIDQKGEYERMIDAGLIRQAPA